jgi:hypothetical protein
MPFSKLLPPQCRLNRTSRPVVIAVNKIDLKPQVNSIPSADTEGESDNSDGEEHTRRRRAPPHRPRPSSVLPLDTLKSIWQERLPNAGMANTIACSGRCVCYYEPCIRLDAVVPLLRQLAHCDLYPAVHNFAPYSIAIATANTQRSSPSLPRGTRVYRSCWWLCCAT